MWGSWRRRLRSTDPMTRPSRSRRRAPSAWWTPRLARFCSAARTWRRATFGACARRRTSQSRTGSSLPWPEGEPRAPRSSSGLMRSARMTRTSSRRSGGTCLSTTPRAWTSRSCRPRRLAACPWSAPGKASTASRSPEMCSVTTTPTCSRSSSWAQAPRCFPSCPCWQVAACTRLALADRPRSTCSSLWRRTTCGGTPWASTWPWRCR
mmetsp:Transcript_46109/g.142625  ORF Transcript_46109/g.142625 Transcript_46109/m.142625 type:complete len:208 (+) Transcript_46109:2500-3123(+)